jgi:hypothetical protein
LFAACARASRAAEVHQPASSATDGIYRDIQGQVAAVQFPLGNAVIIYAGMVYV